MHDISKITVFFIILISTVGPFLAQAADIRVPAGTNIQTAIDNATDGDTLIIDAGTYNENLTITNKISLRGLETARTIIDSPSTTPALSINNTTDVTIQNLTFANSTIGIEVTNSTSNIVITNNVFVLGSSATKVGTAIDVTDNTSQVSILFNTFFGNLLAIDRASDLVIENNIFSDNTTDIETGSFPDTKIDFNCFKLAAPIIQGPNAKIDAIILFSNTAIKDFHLRATTDCIDNGRNNIQDIIDSTQADMGAYGGQLSDLLPYPPQDVLLTIDASQNITVTWNENLSYLVKGDLNDNGGYRIFYDFDAPGLPYNGTNASGDNSPVEISAFPLVSQFTLNNITAPNSTITKPVVTIAPSSQTLDVSWTADPNVVVSSYTLNYGIASETEITKDLITETKFTITGLTNNTTYKVKVTAHFQPKYYFAISAYDQTGTGFTDAHESNLSEETSINVGSEKDEPSDVVTAIPEKVIPFPNLPGEGCFIATAAFGFYSAPQVQILRDFRDQYLLTNKPGKLFVDWYYANGPTAAIYLNRYTVLKPVTRVLLFPLIYFSKFLLNTSLATQLIIFLMLFFIIIVFIYRLIKTLHSHRIIKCQQR